MDVSQYLEVFIDESKEHVQAMNEKLLQLEKSPDLATINEVFRSAHTLKGMSATMGFEDLANLTHQLENVLEAMRSDKLSVSAAALDIVFESVEHLETMIISIAEGGDGKLDVRQTVTRLKQLENGDLPTQQSTTEIKQIQDKEESGATIDLDEFEITVLQQSREQGFENLHITIALREDCLLKAARVFMVFEVLEQIGEVIKSIPAVEDLEEEQFDREFQVLLVTNHSKEDVSQRIRKVSEVEEVNVETLVTSQMNSEVAATLEAEKIVGKDQEPTEQAEIKVQDKKNQMNKTIRVNIERLDTLMNLFEELVIDRGRLEKISTDLKNTELQETVERMSRISGDLQNIILTMRMIPIEQVFNRFPRMVRQLARDLNKKIDLQIVGAETELDRTVIDEIGDPLVHLIRNAIDHGIETPDERRKNGKYEEGTIILKAYHSGNHVIIDIEDNGHGIDRDKVIRKAIDRGIITKEAANNLTDRQVYELILASGFSTADKISDISGRGVGLDVVKNTIESLGGNITINSTLGKGSKFSIQLPLTLSIISVLLVEIREEKYAIPLSSIIETAIVKKEDILSAHNKKVIDFRGKVVPLVFLNEIFKVPDHQTVDEMYSVVIVRKGDKMAGLVVDSFIGQQEVVLKALGNYLSSVFAISGATILGDGQVALIVDCNALIK